MVDDVPSLIDLRTMTDAQNWEHSAMGKRPWRREFFDAIVHELLRRSPTPDTILELGSGPGFLAERILTAMPQVAYTALDFSSAMHALAGQRLGALASRVSFEVADFRDSHWADTVPKVDAVVTVQAVHELRHKRHAARFYAQVCSVLPPDGVLLACDHFVGDGGMIDTALFMTPDEHEVALASAGFADIQRVRQDRGLVLFRAITG